MMEQSVADGVIILSGGPSSRMGEPKALVEINSKPMLQRVMESLAKSGFQSAILSLKNHEQWQQIMDSITIKQVSAEQYQIENTDLSFEILFDPATPNKNNSPIIGLISGVAKAIDKDWQTIQVVPCDVPYLNPQLPPLLFNNISVENNCAVAYSNRGIEPLLFCANSKALNVALNSDVSSAREVISKLHSFKVGPEIWSHNDITNQCFTNVNSLDDMDFNHK
ncbi:MAG: NTP transferase domain-containing protein [Candidatus Thalassarchaeaceae archaeon]|jgi:molybdopterin-guanine dinucleotide biosynthesis protein A|nr:NTP transferase domain-containing protein [Candidatus Thalassarchaeaceae archaeon]